MQCLLVLCVAYLVAKVELCYVFSVRALGHCSRLSVYSVILFSDASLESITPLLHTCIAGTDKFVAVKMLMLQCWGNSTLGSPGASAA